jgi:hypothetical protein
MSAPKHELRLLLEQDCQMAADLADSAVKLVIDVQAIHYWTTFSLETLRQIHNIGKNLDTLLTECAGLLDKPKQFHEDEKGGKLAKTIYGLYRALPSTLNKYTEQLSKRRRQRIMGIEPEDVGDIEPEQVEEEHKELQGLRDSIKELYGNLRQRAQEIPAELAVSFGMPAEAAEKEQQAAAAAQQAVQEEAEQQQEAAQAPSATQDAAPGQPDPPAKQEKKDPLSGETVGPKSADPSDHDELSPV